MKGTLARMELGVDGQHGQAGPTASRPTYRLIQILRAVAALMVVTHHATIMLAQRNHLAIPTWINGESGVDLFFVISGFVMTISAVPLRESSHPARTFLARRIERVVPMYWLITTFKVVALILVPVLGFNAMGTPEHVISSYLFFPSYNPEHALEPVVVVGWTLNFEMAFYFLFALPLAIRAKPVWVIAPPIVALAAWRLIRGPEGPVALEFFESTLPLEFLYGVLLGLALPYVRRLPWLAGLAALLAGFAPLLLWRDPGLSPWRGLLWGLPALAVVAGALVMESHWGRRSPRWMLELGDASYSVYLAHTFSLPAVGLLLSQFRGAWAQTVMIALPFAVLLSTAAGELAYRAVERPLTQWFKGRRRTAIPAIS